MKKLTFISVPLSYSDAKQLALDLGLRLLTFQESKGVITIDSSFWVQAEGRVNNSDGGYLGSRVKRKTVLTEYEEPKNIKQLRNEQAN